MNRLEELKIELEVDSIDGEGSLLFETGSWEGPTGTISIRISESEGGHGFGLTEVIAIVISVSAGVASELVADAVRAAVGRVIRRAKRADGRTFDGSRAGLTELIESDRNSPSNAQDEGR